MTALIAQADEILTRADDPALSTVVELGRRDPVREWIGRKFEQWETTRPYLTDAYQAAPIEPRRRGRFGQLEFLSRRWWRGGWTVDRDVASTPSPTRGRSFSPAKGTVDRSYLNRVSATISR